MSYGSGYSTPRFENNSYSSERKGFGFGSGQGRGVFSSQNSAPSVQPVTDFSTLPPIKKNLYVEHSQVAAMTAQEVAKAREENKMHVKANNPSTVVPKPIKTFDQMAQSFGPVLTKALAKQNFASPTFIQAQGWPMALTGANMVGIAQTGSGKTISFMMPALCHILANRPSYGSGAKHPLVLVLAPTRELACQIQEVGRQVGNIVNVSTVCVYGGVPKGPQIRSLRAGADAIVATPGRLLDFMDAGLVDVSRVSYLVLDEADRMLDMGFEPQIRRILQSIRPDRQVLMWSATWPKAVQRLAHDMLGRDFIQVTIGSAEATLTTNKRIRQSILLISSEEEKEAKLGELLAAIYEHGPSADPKETNPSKLVPKTIIFSNKKRICDDLAWKAHSEGYAVDSLHGDKGQPERDAILAKFRSGECPLLIATDVAARGLDVKDVRVVINYDMPLDVEDYVHRIGRTARGSDVEVGFSYTFFNTFADKGTATELVKLLESAEQTVPDGLRVLVRVRPQSTSSGRWGGRGGGHNHFSRGGYRNTGGNRGGSYNPRYSR